MANGRKICAFVSLLMLMATTFGAVNVSAGHREPTHDSNEIWFWDNFEDEVLTDKWDVSENPPLGEIGISGYTVSSNTWQSWFLESYWGILMNSVNVPGSFASVASKPQYQILTDYIILFNFTPIPTIPAPPYQPCGNFKVVGDGNVLLRIEGCSVPIQTAELYAYDGTTRVFIENLEWGKQYFFEIRAHITATPPTYDVYLKETYEGTFDFYSDPPVTLTRLTLGDDSGALDEYGEAAWDNIIVAELHDLHDLPWTDDFDNLPAEIEDWTTIIYPDPGNTFEPVIPSPPVPPAPSSDHALYMDESIGGVAHGFTPYFDIPHNANYYVVSFEFLYISVTNRITVFSDGNIRLVFDTGNWLKAYIDETTSQPIDTLPNAYQWYIIRCEIDPINEEYFVFIDGADYGPFDFLENPQFRKAPSNLFLGDHVYDRPDGEAYWDNGKVTLNDPPELDWCGPPDYIDVGVYPDSGDTNTIFTYCVKYSDPDGDPPDPGPPSDPKVHINKGGVPYGSSPFSMAFDSWVGAPNDYIAGALYIYSKQLGVVGLDYTYYFTASDDKGLPAISTPELDSPDVYSPNQPPVLDWCGTLGYTSDGVNPDYGDINTIFTYCVKYSDPDGDPPDPGPPSDPKVHINKGGAPYGSSPFSMAFDSWVGAPSDYIAGALYIYSKQLGVVGLDYTYYFTASDDKGLPAIPTPEKSGPVVLDANEPWWKFRHDLRNTGYSASTAPNSAHVAWSTKLDSGAGIFYSSPAVANDKVFIGREMYKFYAVDKNTGSIIWSYDLPTHVYSSPAVANGKVFFGSGIGDAKIYALDEDTGSFVWSFQAGDTVISSPSVANGKVFVGCTDGYLYALDEASGNLEWKYKTDWEIGLSSPSVADGLVFIGGRSWPGMKAKLYALDEDTGILIWDFEVAMYHNVEASPAVVDDKVFIVTSNGPFSEGYVYALNKYNGNLIWSYYEDTGGSVSSPAVAYDKLFFGAWYGRIYALDKDTGDLIWIHDASGDTTSSPAVADGKVFITTSDYLYSLNENTGDFIWSYPMWADQNSPAIADGMVFICDASGTLYAFD